LIHPDIHPKIARQRHEGLLTNAERRRIGHAARRLCERRSASAEHARQYSRRAADSAWEV
jgi:hypothetical protein